MKKNLLCLVSNIRAVALCLVVVCSTIASWAAPSVDDTFIEGNLGYTVTSVSPYECRIWSANQKITEAQISETVSYDGIELKVTSLSENAFRSCRSLSSIEIPNSVTSIGEAAFMSCSSLSSVIIPSSVTSIGTEAFFCCPLTQVTCKGTTPPECASDAFGEVDLAKCTLVVPTGSEGTYMTINVWKGFGKIVDPAGVEEVTVDDNAFEVERYNINGVKLSAPQVGVNIVKMSDGSVKKVVVNE